MTEGAMTEGAMTDDAGDYLKQLYRRAMDVTRC